MTPPASSEIVAVDVEPFALALREPFGIAGGAQSTGGGLLVRVTLASGAVGLGEAAPFAAYNGETVELVRAALVRARSTLIGRRASAWRALGRDLADAGLPGAARCALETAALDALLRELGLDMTAFFGGAASSVETDVTVTTGDATSAARAATEIAKAGYVAVKVKVGGRRGGRVDLDVDRARVASVASAFVALGLSARVQLDANAGLTSDEAIELVRALGGCGVAITLFEQPVARGDLDGMRRVRERAGVRVAADESAASVADVVAIARERAADVVNLKLMKSGVVESLDMAVAARALGLGTMIGGLVESEIAMTTSASFAAGLGGFGFADLDTPLFLAGSPCVGGLRYEAPRVSVAHVTVGHGVTLAAWPGAAPLGPSG